MNTELGIMHSTNFPKGWLTCDETPEHVLPMTVADGIWQYTQSRNGECLKKQPVRNEDTGQVGVWISLHTFGDITEPGVPTATMKRFFNEYGILIHTLPKHFLTEGELRPILHGWEAVCSNSEECPASPPDYKHISVDATAYGNMDILMKPIRQAFTEE